MNNFNVGGRPLFERDRFKNENPAPAQYKPDKFQNYDKSTQSFNRKQSLGREIRFQDKGEKVEPSPASYANDDAKIRQKKVVAHTIPQNNRKLLDKVKTMDPGPQSYDTVTGLSMCSSTQKMLNTSIAMSKQNLNKKQDRTMDQIPFEMQKQTSKGQMDGMSLKSVTPMERELVNFGLTHTGSV